MRRFVLSITPTVNDDGSTLQYLFSPDSWATKPTDTPSNKPVMGLLKNPGTLRRELFAGQRVTGAIRPSYGNVVLANPAPDADGPGLLDDWIGYGLAGAPMTLYWGEVGAAFPAGYTVVYRAFCHSFWADADVITIRQRDALQLLEQPVVTDGFAGTGGIEGGGAVAKRKQFVAGDPGFIEPILVDANKQVYFVQSTGTGGLESNYIPNGTTVETSPFDVYDNGVEITRATTAYATSTAMLAEAPAAGQVKYWYGPASQSSPGYDGPVYFRLGSPPEGDLRVFPQGYPTDADHQRLGLVLGSWNAAHMALRAGVPAGNVTLGQAQLNVVSALVDDDRSYLDLLSDQALAVQGWFGFDRLGVFRSGWLLDPVETTPAPTSAYSFTEANIGELRREPVAGMEVPVWSVALTAGDAWPSQLAGAASATMRDYLTRKVWSSISGVAAATKLRDPGADHQNVNIRCRLLQNATGTRLWLERYFHLYGGARHFYSFSAPMSDELLALDLHDVVTLTHRRFGLSAGQDFRIASITIDCAAPVPKMRFVLWGGTPGVYSGVIASTPDSGAFVDPVSARNSMGLFTGTMSGAVSVAASTSGSSDLSSIGEFAGLMVGAVTGDPYWADVVLLLSCNGTDGSTSIADSSTFARTGTGNSTLALSTTRSKYGSASIKVTRRDPGGLVFGPHADFARANNEPWTMECWVYVVNSENFTSAPVLMYWLDNNSVADAVSVYGLTPQIDIATSGAGGPSPTTVSKNAWHHIAITNDGTTETLWINGASAGSFARSIGASATGTIYVGGFTGSGSADTTEVYIDDVRVTKGVARYTTTFTPPTAELPTG